MNLRFSDAIPTKKSLGTISKMFIYSFLECTVIYSTLQVNVYVGICSIICEERYFIHLSYYILITQIKETKCNGVIKL